MVDVNSYLPVIKQSVEGVYSVVKTFYKFAC